jgi:L-arabinose isomerase
MATGSVCGSQQLVQVLTELNRPRAFVHGELDDPAAHARITEFALGSAASQRLRRARFGMLGHRTVGMTEVTFHELDLMRQFGSMVYYKGADRLLSAMSDVNEDDARAVWQMLRARCGRCTADEASGLIAARCYRALRAWAETDQLHGIAVGCYPDLMGVVCLACGLLAEEGIVTSCEGDMNSAILTAVLQLMSGRPVHNTDFLFADASDNTCTMSHCGNSAVSLAARRNDVTIAPVRLMDRGAVTLYPAAPGRVTIANLCGVRGSYRLMVYTGEAVPTEMTFPGIPVKVRLDVPVQQFLDETAEFGAGHHWMVAYGDLKESLAVFAKQTGLRLPTFRIPPFEGGAGGMFRAI